MKLSFFYCVDSLIFRFKICPSPLKSVITNKTKKWNEMNDECGWILNRPPKTRKAFEIFIWEPLSSMIYSVKILLWFCCQKMSHKKYSICRTSDNRNWAFLLILENSTNFLNFHRAHWPKWELWRIINEWNSFFIIRVKNVGSAWERVREIERQKRKYIFPMPRMKFSFFPIFNNYLLWNGAPGAFKWALFSKLLISIIISKYIEI